MYKRYYDFMNFTCLKLDFAVEVYIDVSSIQPHIIYALHKSNSDLIIFPNVELFVASKVVLSCIIALILKT